MIAIIDYGMGNLRSVQKGFEKVGHQAIVTSDPAQLAAADKVVLPGVGAFEDAMTELRRRELVEPMLAAIDSGKPFWASAWGCNCSSSVGYENGRHQGLGVLAGEVVRFELPPDTRSPTWAGINWPSAAGRRSWRGLPRGRYVYFVHSYYVVPRDAGGDCHRDRLRRAVLLDDLAGQLVCHAIPPGRRPVGRLRMLGIRREGVSCRRISPSWA